MEISKKEDALSVLEAGTEAAIRLLLPEKDLLALLERSVAEMQSNEYAVAGAVARGAYEDAARHRTIAVGAKTRAAAALGLLGRFYDLPRPGR